MAVNYRDYYKVLGVDRTAEHADIQRAYRKLARKFHPDINKSPDAEEKFKEINEAYEVLGDREKRKKYDSLGADWKAGEGVRPSPGWEGGGVRFTYGGSEEDFSDFFRSIFGEDGGFGERGRAARRRRGRDVEAVLEISPEEAVSGGRKLVEVETLQAAPDGQVAPARKKLEVHVPPGVTDGSVIRLPGEGGGGAAGGEKGDLYLRIRIRPDARFAVEGHDVVASVNLSPWEAALGARVDVPVIGGSVRMKIPPGTQSGHVFRLRGKGIPPSGDMLVKSRIVVPERLTDRERALFEELAKESPFRPRG
jgi:curved DNA-binding protein